MALSEIRVNTTKTRTGVGTITYTETGPVITGIATASNFKTGSTNVHSTGVELSNINTGGSTATFGGPISGTNATFSGTVSIGGTLTYEDVTNIDSVGLITARNGITVSAGDLVVGAASYNTTGSFGARSNGEFRSVLPQNTASSTMLGAIGGASNGFNIVIDSSNNQTYKFHNGSAQSVTITDNGRLYIGTINSGTYDGIQPQIQLEGTNYNTSSMSLFCNSNTVNNAPQLQLGKSRSGSDGGTTALQNGDRVGSIYGIAADGSDRNSSVGSIQFYVDGSVSTDQTPGSIRFATTASNGSTPTERLRINSAGKVGINTASPAHHLDVVGNLRVHTTTPALYLTTNANTAESAVIRFGDTGSFQRGSIQYDFAGNSHLRFKMGGAGNNIERLNIEGSSGNLTNTGSATSYVTTQFASNFAKLDLRGTNIANSNHYILSYGEGHANDHEFHMVNTVGHLVFRTGTGSLTERVRINSAGEMSIGGQHADHAYDANSYGNPSLLIAGDDNADILTIMNDDPSPNNGDYASLGFRVAGQSTGSYSKAAIIAERNGGYNAIDLVFACGTDADATRTTTSHEIMRVNHTRTVRILSNSTDNDFKNQNYPGDTSGIKLQNWPSSNTTGAFVSSTYALKAGNGTAQVCAWTAQSTATGTVPDMFYSVRTGDAQQHIVRIGGNDIGRGMEISNNITLTGARNSNIISERFRVLPSENNGYDDSHIMSAAQTSGNWEQGSSSSNASSSWGWLWQYASANNGTRQVRSGIAYDHKGSEEFKYWSSYGDHTWYVDSAASGDETAETCSTKAMQICRKGSVINTANPTYGIYTHSSVQTSNGGIKNVQYLEDCYGQWIVVAKIQQSSHLQSAMASVAQIDTSLGQATGTEWSASFGGVYPIAVRYVSSSNWKNWRDNRGVDFIQGVPHGRKWKNFFSNGASSGMTSATGGVGSTKYGWTCDGAWDGKGRWHNPNFNWWRMSDPGTGFSADFCNQSFFTSATAANASTALNLNWANDAKFGVHATAATGGQDTEVTSVYGYDDNVYGHEDNYPSSPANNSGSDITAMPLWICLNVTGIGQFH